MAESEKSPETAVEDKKHRLTMREVEEFKAVFPVIVEELLEMVVKICDVPQVRTWFQKVLIYNVPDEGTSRSKIFLTAYKYFNPDQVLEKPVYVMAWCLECLQVFSFLFDDLLNQSKNRRGRPCWYLQNNLGPMAFNDALFVYKSAFMLLKKHVGTQPYYKDISALFHKGMFRATLGLQLDSYLRRSKDVKLYTMQHFNTITDCKVGTPRFYHPVLMAMIVGGKVDQELLPALEKVLVDIGCYYQLIKDNLHCFGYLDRKGRTSNEIAQGACSCLIARAVEMASEEQLQALQENFAVDDPEKIDQVKELYQDMGLRGIYAVNEHRTAIRIEEEINELPPNAPKVLLIHILKFVRGKAF